MELIKPANKGKHMNYLENLFISLYRHQSILIHKQNTSEHNLLFEQLHNTQLEHACVKAKFQDTLIPCSNTRAVLNYPPQTKQSHLHRVWTFILYYSTITYFTYKLIIFTFHIIFLGHILNNKMDAFDIDVCCI
jgi:hypothetical protein